MSAFLPSGHDHAKSLSHGTGPWLNPDHGSQFTPLRHVALEGTGPPQPQKTGQQDRPLHNLANNHADDQRLRQTVTGHALPDAAPAAWSRSPQVRERPQTAPSSRDSLAVARLGRFGRKLVGASHATIPPAPSACASPKSESTQSSACCGSRASSRSPMAAGSSMRSSAEARSSAGPFGGMGMAMLEETVTPSWQRAGRERDTRRLPGRRQRRRAPHRRLPPRRARSKLPHRRQGHRLGWSSRRRHCERRLPRHRPAGPLVADHHQPASLTLYDVALGRSACGALAIARRRQYHQGSGHDRRAVSVLASQRPRHARSRRDQVVSALTNPHYRSGYALVANTVGTTGIGVAYWAIAAHLYDRQVLGQSSALVSALVLVSSIAQLNLGSTLPRFLPLAYRRSGRLIRYTYIATSVVALLVGFGFVTLLPKLNAQWHFLGGSAGLALAFVAAAVVWGIFALQDAALTGLRHASVVPVENVVYGVLKLILLIAIASMLPATGIFVSWVLPLVLIIPAINWLIFGTYLKHPESLGKGARIRPREVIRFAAVDYAGALLGQIYISVMPLLVLSILGAAANGTFYVAWTITSGLALVANNFATSLLVEGAAAPDRLPELTRGVLIRCALLMTLGVGLLVLAARPILTI